MTESADNWTDDDVDDDDDDDGFEKVSRQSDSRYTSVIAPAKIIPLKSNLMTIHNRSTKPVSTQMNYTTYPVSDSHAKTKEFNYKYMTVSQSNMQSSPSTQMSASEQYWHLQCTDIHTMLELDPPHTRCQQFKPRCTQHTVT